MPFRLFTGPPEQDFPPRILSDKVDTSDVQNAYAPVPDRGRVDFFFDNYKALPNIDRCFDVMERSDDELGRLGVRKAYFMVCGLDLFRDEAIVWRERLLQAGKETKMVLYPGLPHGLGLGYIREDIFPPKHKWDDDCVEGVRWLTCQW